jgi:hypothetical protein
MALQKDFEKYLSDEGLKIGEASLMSLKEIEKYVKLMEHNPKIATVYGVAVTRIFADNPQLYPFAEDMFTQVFTPYSTKNPIFESTKNNILIAAQKTQNNQTPQYTIEDIKEQIQYESTCELEPGEKPILLIILDDVEKSKKDLGLNTEDILHLIDYAIQNDLRIGKKPAMECVEQWASEKGLPFPYLGEAIKDDIKVNGKPALEWAIENGKQVDGKLPVVWACENNVKVEGQDVVQWVCANISRLNSPIIGPHTERAKQAGLSKERG